MFDNTTENPAARPTREELKQRLSAVRFWRSEGLGRQEVMRNAMAEWYVSQRTAQKYIRQVERNLAQPPKHEERASILRLSQLQRERLLSKISERLVEASSLDAKTLVQLVNAARTLIDARDRAARAMAELQDDAPHKEEPHVAPPTPSEIHAPEQRKRAARGRQPSKDVAPAVATPERKDNRQPEPKAQPEVAKPPAPSSDEMALRERCADIMEEMEAMMQVSKVAKERGDPMRRDGDKTAPPGWKAFPIPKTKPVQELLVKT